MIFFWGGGKAFKIRFENNGNVVPMLKQTTQNEDVWENGEI